MPHWHRDAHLVTADLELGHVPGRVLVRRPLDVSELRLIRRIVVLDVERELELEELVPLVPVHLGVEAEERARVLLHRGCHKVSWAASGQITISRALPGIASKEICRRR